MKRQHRSGSLLRSRPWWRPLALSAATAAAIAMLFNPMPAFAAPPAIPPAVPDAGLRPIPQGQLVLPGQAAPTTTTPTSTTPISTTGLAPSPVVAKIEAGRAAVTKIGEDLTRYKQDLDLTTTQLATADQKVVAAQAAVTLAQGEVSDAAAASVRNAAAMPPGTLGSGLSDLDSLARINRGESATEEAASRQLSIAQAAYDAALAEQRTFSAHLTEITALHTKTQKELDKKSAAQQKLEQEHSDELQAADAAQAAQDAQAGAGYLGGENAGRGADPRAIAALTFALAQRGDPYVWSEEGPDEYDCSGLMWAAYRSPGAGNYPLTRVSKDQYYQTRSRAVDRYSLLPGDLLFFSSSSSWTGIHHVAMYAGDGMMVEAPRTGLNVRLTPVRWTRLFGATRIFGSIEGKVEGPTLGSPDPETPSDNPPATTKPPTKPTSKPPSSPKPPTIPSTSPKPPTSPSTSPKPPTSPSTSPKPPTSPSNPPSDPSPSPTRPSPTADPTTPAAPTTTPADSQSEAPESDPTSKPASASASAAAAAKADATSASGTSAGN
ncbi:MAG: NlpC/P60 family protein [Actinoplanes sp.]